jgi:glutaredoxin
MNEVVLYSKPGCCLCDEVKAQLRRLARAYKFQWRELNILEDPELRDRFAEKIPVVFIDGQPAFEYTLDEKEFVKRLGAATPRGPAPR